MSFIITKEVGANLVLFILPFCLLLGILVEFEHNTFKFPVNIQYQASEKIVSFSNSHLRLMKRVDQMSKKRGTRSYYVTSGNNNVQKAVARRKLFGVSTPIILEWSIQGIKTISEFEESLMAAQCGGCRITRNRDSLNESVAVVFFNRHHGEDLPDPSTRNPNQVYVFWSVETPSKTVGQRAEIEESKFDGIFNLTMNFRLDSDIRQYFGTKELALRQSKSKDSLTQIKKRLREKMRMAIWFVSNCYRIPGAIARMRYVMAMVKAGLKLDKFGKCFEGERVHGSVIGNSHSQYKFYIAFENSIHCPDYVTEKLWRNALEGEMVPVIFGPTKNDVAKVAPKNSYIHVDDFKSPAELVKHLNYLDSNDTAFMEYHKWREEDIDSSLRDEDIGKYNEATLCRLCRRQVIENHPRKTIPSVSKWLYDTGFVDDECLTPRYKINKTEENEMKEFFKTSNSYDDV